MTLLIGVAVVGCGSIDDDDGEGSSGREAPITVGLVVPLSGVYAPLGEDMKAGWDLYLREHDGKLGGRDVTTKVVDEGETPETGVPAVQRLLQDDEVDVLVGVVNSAVALGVSDAVEQAGKLLIVANAGANQLDGSNRYIWRTSFANEQVSYAIGKHAASTAEASKGAYAIGADYAAGDEHMAGFVEGFEDGGGKLIGEAKTPFGTTQDFQPYLARIRRSGAGLTYAFYAGAEAVSFVKQYAEFGLKDQIPLYAAGFLTEGGVLAAQGAAAGGLRTSLHYAPTLDNPANASFARVYTSVAGRPPTVYAVQAWDAALVLDRALETSGSASGDELADALDSIGEIESSPRGPWTFTGQSPSQTMYLREVSGEDDAIANEVVESLGDFGPSP